MYNLGAELAKNLKVYSDFIAARSAVNYPDKMDVPMVWDLYMDTAKPVGEPLSAYEQPVYSPAPIAFSPEAPASASAPIAFEPEPFAESAAAPVTYRSPVTGDIDLLGQVNDRLKTQARRYPHPITNDLDALA